MPIIRSVRRARLPSVQHRFENPSDSPGRLCQSSDQSEGRAFPAFSTDLMVDIMSLIGRSTTQLSAGCARVIGLLRAALQILEPRLQLFRAAGIGHVLEQALIRLLRGGRLSAELLGPRQ